MMCITEVVFLSFKCAGFVILLLLFTGQGVCDVHCHGGGARLQTLDEASYSKL